MPDIRFGCLPTIIGSMPQKDPDEACDLITRYLKDIPAWPQLPNRSPFESMNTQFSEGFPGLSIKDDKLVVYRSEDLSRSLEQLYNAYLENDVNKFPVSPEFAAGLQAFLHWPKLSPMAVKGQLPGPITWGLCVTDTDGRAIIYDDILGDAAAKFLRLKAAWQEKELREISPNTIIFIDEPYMEAYGSSNFITLSKEKVISLMEETLGGIHGIKGIHCCGNTDWPVLLSTSTNILSFDAYGYAGALALYPNEVKTFLSRPGNKGAIAWGIVPNESKAITTETVASLKDRLEEAMAPYTRNGLSFRQMLEQSLLTPSCGLVRLTSDESARVLELLSDLSKYIRQRYL